MGTVMSAEVLSDSAVEYGSFAVLYIAESRAYFQDEQPKPDPKRFSHGDDP